MPGFKIHGEGKGPSATVESARAHRWEFYFTGGDIGDLSNLDVYALSSQRPVLEIDKAVMHAGINQIHLPGKYKWNPINVKFYETLKGSTLSTYALFKYWSEKVINLKQHTVKLPQESQTQARVAMLNGAGVGVYFYVLYNVWPSKVEPAELTYTSSEISTVQVTLTYDAADEVG